MSYKYTLGKESSLSFPSAILCRAAMQHGHMPAAGLEPPASEGYHKRRRHIKRASREWRTPARGESVPLAAARAVAKGFLGIKPAHADEVEILAASIATLPIFASLNNLAAVYSLTREKAARFDPPRIIDPASYRPLSELYAMEEIHIAHGDAKGTLWRVTFAGTAIAMETSEAAANDALDTHKTSIAAKLETPTPEFE